MTLRLACALRQDTTAPTTLVCARGTTSAGPDRQSRTIVDTTETLTAAWYVTGGMLDAPAAEVVDPAATSTVTGWTAPPAATTVELALVLRDSRGGSDVAQATFVVVGTGSPSP